MIPMCVYISRKLQTSLTPPQSVLFHYFEVHYGALVEENLMVYITQKLFSAQVTPFLKSVRICLQKVT